MIGTVEELVSPEIALLLAAGRIEKRKRPHGVEQDVPRCSVCKIWLNGRDVPAGQDGHCGFCIGPDPGGEIMEAAMTVEPMSLPTAVIKWATKDAASQNGHRAAARQWLVEGMDFWLDALNCKLDYVKGQIAERVL